jgi:ribosome recycling factor
MEKMHKDKEISEDELRDAETDLQKAVDEKNKKVDEMIKHKEKDVMTV